MMFSRDFIQTLRDLISDPEYLQRSKMRPQDFTRTRKMSFPQMLCLIIGYTKKSLQVGIYEFLSKMKSTETYSKQAFSKGRLRINPEAIKELFDLSVREFYAKAEFLLYNGYRLCAIDGVRCNLPPSEELYNEYGEQLTRGKYQIQALGSCMYDVLNHILVDVSLSPCRANERELAREHIANLGKYADSSVKELLLFDRGYPSAELLHYVDTLGYSYVMRCSSEFVNRMELDGDDCIITYTFRQMRDEPKTMRILRLPLPSGETEILVTNIFDPEFTTENFRDIYKMRWEIETKYDELKNKLQIENFSGISQIAVLQDFYAAMLVSNMVQFVAYDNSDWLEEYNSLPEHKLQYKLNISMAISAVKSHTAELFLCAGESDIESTLRQITEQLKHCLTPIRKNRSFPRTVKHRSNKFPQNKRSA